MILGKLKIAEIEARYETPHGDPECTCQRKDVDFYDSSGCELCDRRSDFNRAHLRAMYMLDLHGFQDIGALIRSHEEMRTALEKTEAALRLWQHAEDMVANCDDHEPEMAPESCESCFPYCDKARLALHKAHDSVFRVLNPQPVDEVKPK